MVTASRSIAPFLLFASFLCSCSGPNQETPSADSSLFDAAQRGNIEAVRSLIQEGVNVNGRNELGETPLFGAVLCNSRAIAELLIHNGADVNARDKNGVTPLHAAGELVGHNNVKAMRSLLLKHGAKE